MVEATEIAEKIRGEEHEAHSAEADANFRKFTGIYLGIVAMLLAITALGGSNATKTMLAANIQASDIYGYYQAKNIRQTVYQLTAEQLETELLSQPGMPEVARSKIDGMIKRFRERVDRYESDPSTGEGKKELLAKAKEFEAKLDAIRTFRHQEFLRIAIADVAGDLELHEVEAELTLLAETDVLMDPLRQKPRFLAIERELKFPD